MTDHVNPIDRQEMARRLNELERVTPIYRAALEWIATSSGAAGPVARVAEQALREADREDSQR